MAPTRSGTSAKQKPRGVNPGMAAEREGPLSQTSNIINDDISSMDRTHVIFWNILRSCSSMIFNNSVQAEAGLSYFPTFLQLAYATKLT